MGVIAADMATGMLLLSIDKAGFAGRIQLKAGLRRRSGPAITGSSQRGKKKNLRELVGDETEMNESCVI
jgi:hypothetical protein